MGGHDDSRVSQIKRGYEHDVRDVAIPGARFQIIEDGGHALLFEIPEKFNRAVLDFFQT